MARLPPATPAGRRSSLLEGIHRLIAASESGAPGFPPTLIYNEGWMLRLILDWFSRNPVPGHLLTFEPGAQWFSEGLLPSPFRARHRSDARAEARTHADGLVGHFAIGSGAKADATLLPDATQLLVLEAKISSALSAGTRNAPAYDQAARSVACIAQMHQMAGRSPGDMTSLGFFVLAPGSFIQAGVFASKLDKGSIEAAVSERAQLFQAELPTWLDDCFRPTLGAMHIEALSWEDLLAEIEAHDTASSSTLHAFYEQCLKHNTHSSKSLPTGLGAAGRAGENE